MNNDDGAVEGGAPTLERYSLPKLVVVEFAVLGGDDEDGSKGFAGIADDLKNIDRVLRVRLCFFSLA